MENKISSLSIIIYVHMLKKIVQLQQLKKLKGVL